MLRPAHFAAATGGAHAEGAMIGGSSLSGATCLLLHLAAAVGLTFRRGSRGANALGAAALSLRNERRNSHGDPGDERQNAGQQRCSQSVHSGLPVKSGLSTTLVFDVVRHASITIGSGLVLNLAPAITSGWPLAARASTCSIHAERAKSTHYYARTEPAVL